MAALIKRCGAHAKLQNEDDVVRADQLVLGVPALDINACRNIVLDARLRDGTVHYTGLSAYP